MSARPKKLKRAVIKEELAILLENYVEALILNQFLYWSERKDDFDKFIEEEKLRTPDLAISPAHGWIYKSAKELTDELMLDISEVTMRRYLNKIVEKGYLEQRNNPEHRWDRCLQYRPNMVKIQLDLQSIGYALEGYPLVIKNSILQNEACILQDEVSNQQIEGSKLQNEASNLQNEGAIPEITTEITTEREEAAPENFKRDYLTDVFLSQGKASEQTAANPDDQYWVYRDGFKNVFQQTMERYPNQIEADEIIKLSQEPGASLDRWQSSLRECILNWTGNNSPPLARIIEVYRCGGNYEQWRQKKYPDPGAINESQEEPAEVHIITDRATGKEIDRIVSGKKSEQKDPI